MKEKVYDVRGFKFEDVLDESRKYSTPIEKIKYFKYVKKEWINNPPELDPNGPWAKPLDERLENEIVVLEMELGAVRTKRTGKVTLNKNTYDTKDLIWWKGSEPMLVYLFDLLNASGLIDQTQFDNRFALMAKHFKNKNAKNFDNKQLARVYDRMREEGLFRKPKVSSAQKIESIINEIRDNLDELEE